MTQVTTSEQTNTIENLVYLYSEIIWNEKNQQLVWNTLIGSAVILLTRFTNQVSVSTTHEVGINWHHKKAM